MAHLLSKRNIVCLLVFVLFAGIGAYWTRMGQRLYSNEQRFFRSELVSAQATAIEQRLSRSLAATRLLAQRVKENRGMFSGFEEFAEVVMQSIEGIANLQLAPDGIIRQIHPLPGNEAVIGHNILRDDKRREEARQAIRERRMILAGPFELIQGGVAVIGRDPIFLPSEEGLKFWGFASALIYLDNLLSVTELDSLGRKGYSHQLSRVDPETGQRELFSSSSTPLMPDNHAIDIRLPDGGTWHLVMSRSTPTPKWRSTTGYIASLLAGLLMAWIANYMLRQPEKLQQIVEEKTNALERLAYYDHLTELANRRYLSEQIERVVREYQRYRKPAALMYLDLDDFKRVNDSMGHNAGDTLLQQIAQRLNGCVRASDLTARLGGDEFGILLLDSESIRDVGKIADKLINRIEAPVSLGSKSFSVSTSIGITMIPADGDDVASILRNADMAMYSAKRAGKRNFRFFDQSLQAEAVRKLQLDDDLAVAIEQGQFVMHYQPIIDLATGERRGYEALVRWRHPQRGLLLPERFVGVAEGSEKIIAIGYWVIREVCLAISRNATDCHLPCRYSINLSPKQFKDPLLLENIREIVSSSGIDAAALEFEVTESCVMEDVDEAIRTLEQLKSIGISVAIDDFGTGYSSLALLKRLPVDNLKIDRSFIHDLESDPSDQKIVQGLISMAHKLQLQVVAEGVETDSQLALLKSYRCDLGQGYFFSRPSPLA